MSRQDPNDRASNRAGNDTLNMNRGVCPYTGVDNKPDPNINWEETSKYKPSMPISKLGSKCNQRPRRDYATSKQKNN